MSYVMTIRLPDGATLSRPAREAAGLFEVTLADGDLAGIPALRAEVADLGGDVVTENGATAPSSGTVMGGDRWAVLLPARAVSTTVEGVTRRSTACTCGLPLAGVEVAEPRLARRSPVPALASTREGFVVVTADVAGALQDQGLAEGVEVLAVGGSAGVRLLLPTRRLAGGAAGRGGCVECGREPAVIGGVSVAVPARFSRQPAAVLPPGQGWAWHPAMTQQVAVVSPGVRDALIGLGAEVSTIPLRDVTQDEAWLPEEYR